MRPSPHLRSPGSRHLRALLVAALAGACSARAGSGVSAGPGTDGGATPDVVTRDDVTRDDVPTGVDHGDPGRDAPVGFDAGPGRDVAPPGDAGDPCASQSACGACTAGSTCGWCRGLGQCFTGTGAGPSSGACAAGDWAWTENMCAGGTDAGRVDVPRPPVDAGDPCAASAACGACTATAGCGWCGNGHPRCLQGTTLGPEDGSCDLVSWRWGADAVCGSPPPDAGGACRGATDCASCAATTGCGWCDNVGQCYPGTVRGPAGSECSVVAWTVDPTQCL